jgi:anti-sigma regulatory factor (Ser/Thr protein kinase)
MSKDEIMIDGVKYVRVDVVEATKGNIKIVVLDRGFVYVGRVVIEGDFVVITNAKNIRQWGTTKGLGELVNGPTPSTKLDEVGTVRAPLRALISLIDVDQSKWK